MRKAAFTLIELLVVIAIIAILAAILFPVFAQAKMAAKKTASLSNAKQIGTGLMLYSNDFDDVYPYANPQQRSDGSWEGDSDWWGPGWVFKVQPYLKNYGIFRSPGEAQETSDGFRRPTLSYAINAYVDEFWAGKHGAVNIGGNWNFTNPTVGSIGRHSDTILLGQRENSDYSKRWPGNGHGIQGNAPFSGVDWMDSWLGPSNTPNGASTRNWPNGKEGTVSAVYANKAIFVFVDTHAATLSPVATCPDRYGNPDKNMWDGSRQ
jgi:prepilin-type N-terminal cleavage/methylation domain-containing protein